LINSPALFLATDTTHPHPKSIIMRISPLIGGGLCALSLVASAQAQVLYATGSSVGGQNFYYSINPTTGIATRLSPMGTPSNPTTTVGLAFDSSRMPVGITNAGQLVRPNFAANTFTNIGPLGFNPPGIPINAGSLDILTDGRAFIYQTNEYSPLYQVDLATGATTAVGLDTTLTDAVLSAGGSVGGFNQPIIIGMGSIGTTLYGIEGRTSTLVAINPATGDVTVPSGVASQLINGTLSNGNDRIRYSVFSGLTGFDSNNDGQYDKLLMAVNRLDGVPIGALAEVNVTDGTWELIGTGNAPVSFFALGTPPGCRADFNAVGGVTVQDIFDFLAAWFANDPRANFNGAGGITVQDIFDFLSAWFSGC
jgi:hypothetical protein